MEKNIKVEFEIDSLNEILEFNQNLINLISRFNQIKIKSHIEKQKAIKEDLSENETFKTLQNQKVNVFKKLNVLKTEFEKLINIANSDDVKTNLDESSRLLTMSNKLKTSKANCKIESSLISSINKKYEYLLTGFETQIEFINDKTALTVLENSSYVPTKLISSNPNCNLYQCLKRTTKNNFALKVIEFDSKIPDKFSSLRHKAHNILNNQNENIIYYYEEIKLMDRLKCIVLELADDSLEKLIRKNYPKGMPEKIAFFFFEQILNGVIYMHKKGVVHRDLKDSNILLCDYKVKISDFNVCNINTEGLKDAPLNWIGTKSFISPEILKNLDINHELWPKYDVFSLGVLLYVMLYGITPYEYKESLRQDNMMDEALESIKFESREGCNVSSEAIELIKSCLTKINERISMKMIKNSNWFRKFAEEIDSVKRNIEEEYSASKKKFDHISLIRNKKIVITYRELYQLLAK